MDRFSHADTSALRSALVAHGDPTHTHGPAPYRAEQLLRHYLSQTRKQCAADIALRLRVQPQPVSYWIEARAERVACWLLIARVEPPPVPGTATGSEDHFFFVRDGEVLDEFGPDRQLRAMDREYHPAELLAAWRRTIARFAGWSAGRRTIAASMTGTAV